MVRRRPAGAERLDLKLLSIAVMPVSSPAAVSGRWRRAARRSLSGRFSLNSFNLRCSVARETPSNAAAPETFQAVRRKQSATVCLSIAGRCDAVWDAVPATQARRSVR